MKAVTADVELGEGKTTTVGRWPLSLLAAIAVYGLAAIGIVPYSFMLAAKGYLPNLTPYEAILDHYSGLRAVFYHLPAGICALLLARHNKHAVWPAVAVAVWIGAMGIRIAAHSLRGPVSELTALSVLSIIIETAAGVWILGLSWYVWRWSKEGLLR